MSYRNQGNLKADYAPHVASPDEMGFLVLNDVGSILEVSSWTLITLHETNKPSLSWHSVWRRLNHSLWSRQDIPFHGFLHHDFIPSGSEATSATNYPTFVFPFKLSVKCQSPRISCSSQGSVWVLLLQHPHHESDKDRRHETSHHCCLGVAIHPLWFMVFECTTQDGKSRRKCSRNTSLKSNKLKSYCYLWRDLKPHTVVILFINVGKSSNHVTKNERQWLNQTFAAHCLAWFAVN